MKCYDLFSGLGGFSQAFVDRGHDVVRYDNDPQFQDIPNTHLKDIWDLKLKDICDADIILASPPCTHFSVAAIWRHWKNMIPTKETKQQINLVRHTISLIKKANPEYWILENPKGMLRKVLGKPAHTAYWAAYGAPTLKPTDLWGKLPPFDRKMPFKWQKASRGSKQGIQSDKYLENFKRDRFGYVMPRAPALRALIPYDFSLAVCLAVEGKSPQTIITEFSE